MNLFFNIAKRYLFGKKSSNAINIITAISVLGIAIGTAALILVLSVFNGFEGLIAGLLNNFNPDLKLTPEKGKYFSLSEQQLEDLREIPEVLALSRTLEEIAFFEYKGAQVVGAIKGVDEQFRNVSNIDSAIYYGAFTFEKNQVKYGLVGSRLYNQLSINQGDAITPVRIHMPTKKKKGLVKKDYKTMQIYPSGVFSVQSEKEDQYLLCSMDFAERLLDKPNELSAVEFRIKEGVSENEIRAQIKAVVGEGFKMKNRYQQDEAFLKLMNIEKWISFLIVSLTLFIVAFNLVGSLWMIVLDKRRDIATLKALGLEAQGVRKIFLEEGLLISALGLLIGICIALFLFGIQKNFGIVPVPEGFIIDAYPIQLKLIDFMVVILTVMIIGLLASILPANRAAKVSPFIRED